MLPEHVRAFCGQRFLKAKDKDLALLCVRAYNDWLFEEWCGPSAGRLFGAVLVPAVGRRPRGRRGRAQRRSRCDGGVASRRSPPTLGLPSIYCGYWEPLLGPARRRAS